MKPCLITNVLSMLQIFFDFSCSCSLVVLCVFLLVHCPYVSMGKVAYLVNYQQVNNVQSSLWMSIIARRKSQSCLQYTRGCWLTVWTASQSVNPPRMLNSGQPIIVVTIMLRNFAFIANCAQQLLSFCLKRTVDFFLMAYRTMWLSTAGFYHGEVIFS